MPQSQYRWENEYRQTAYDLFSKAIYHTLNKSQPLTYSQIVEGIKDCFRQQKTKFEGSVSWYAVTVKHDLHARNVIEVFTEKGKKLHRLSPPLRGEINFRIWKQFFDIKFSNSSLPNFAPKD